MVNPKKAAKLIREHFEKLTTEQFVENLHKYCPEIFEEEELNKQEKKAETGILSKEQTSR